MNYFKIIIFGALLLFSNAMKSQVSVNVNIGTAPQWGPVGYTEERYYYLPDVEAYYDINTSMFIYYEENVWIHRTYLPRRYSNYDLYSGYKVVLVDYRGDAPYTEFNNHRVKYAKGYHGKAQKNIGPKPGRGNAGGGKHSDNHSAKQNSQGSGANQHSDNHRAKQNTQGSPKTQQQSKSSNKGGSQGHGGKKK